MANSIHVARWLELMIDLDVDVRLISSNMSRSVHPRIQKIFSRPSDQGGLKLSMPALSRYLSPYLWLADRLLNDWLRGFLIFAQIVAFKPQLVHVLELQNAGYPLLKALGITPLRNRPKVFLTNYGSDVYWYQNFPSHSSRLKRLMALADAFSAECERDVQIAKGLGFKNLVLETVPVTGGMSQTELPIEFDESDLRSRTVIAIKGYQGQWGRAVEALSALGEVPLGLLQKYRVEIYSCEEAVRTAAAILENRGVDVTCHPKGALSHDQVLAIFRKSRLYVGLSMSDGISTSMLEAMSQGAIPIQTNTSCASEWLTNEAQGYIASLSSPSNTSDAIVRILTDDEYVKNAQTQNLEVIRDRYDKSKIKKVVEGYYSTLLNQDLFRENEADDN